MSWSTFARRVVVPLVLLLVGPATRVPAQDVTEVGLKGAFLFNFARFTEWPADALRADSTVSACVLGDHAVADALSRTVKGKLLGGREIAVTAVAPNASLPNCHLLYLSGLTESRIVEIVSALRDVPVLTVSDSDTFTKRGGIVQIFVESGTMKFRINSRSARRARLQLSSRLLALAEVIDEDVASVAGLAPIDFLSSSSGSERVSRETEHSSVDWAPLPGVQGRN